MQNLINNLMQIVILAGGQGLRLAEKTRNIPKPMMSISGTPFLEILLMYLANQGFKRFLIVLGYLPRYIPSMIGNGQDHGVDIRYCGDEENLRWGTGGALKRAAPYLDEDFLLIFGDSMLPIQYKSLISKYRDQGGSALLAVYDNNEDTDVINNVQVNADNLLTKYVKNSSEPLDYVDAGALCLKKSVLKNIPSEANVSLEEEIYPLLIKKKQIFAYPTDQRFYDIGTPERLELFSAFYDNHQDST